MLLEDGGGGAYFLVSRRDLAGEVGGATAGHVVVEDVCDAHGQDRPTKKLVRSNACRSCTSRSALQARWNNRVILL